MWGWWTLLVRWWLSHLLMVIVPILGNGMGRRRGLLGIHRIIVTRRRWRHRLLWISSIMWMHTGLLLLLVMMVIRCIIHRLLWRRRRCAPLWVRCILWMRGWSTHRMWWKLNRRRCHGLLLLCLGRGILMLGLLRCHNLVRLLWGRWRLVWVSVLRRGLRHLLLLLLNVVSSEASATSVTYSRSRKCTN